MGNLKYNYIKIYHKSKKNKIVHRKWSKFSKENLITPIHTISANLLYDVSLDSWIAQNRRHSSLIVCS